MERTGDRGDARTAETTRFKRAKLKGGKNFEHNLAIGVITDSVFLQELKEDIEDNLRYIKNRAIKQILIWCLEYYEKYGKAPHLNIQDIFTSKRDDLRPADEDIIEEFLLRLSKKYSKIDDFAAEFEVAEIREALHSARVEEVLKQANKLVKEHKAEEAVELVIKEGLLPTQDRDLESMVLTVTEFITTKVSRPKTLVRPWLTSSSLNMIYGLRGIGKSWLCHILAVSLTRNSGSIDIGYWKTRQGASVLLIDGEMSKPNIQKRLKYLVETYGMGEGHALYLLAEALDLTRSREREAVSAISKQKEVDVLFLDNVSALFPGLDENSKQDWDPVNRWLLSLRAMGLAVVLIHHAGKQGKQRGTSGREDSLDSIIRLSRPKNYEPSQGARFLVRFDKARNALPSANLNTFEISVKDLIMQGGE